MKAGAPTQQAAQPQSQPPQAPGPPSSSSAPIIIGQMASGGGGAAAALRMPTSAKLANAPTHVVTEVIDCLLYLKITSLAHARAQTLFLLVHTVIISI